MSLPVLMTRAELAEYLKISVRTLDRNIEEYKYPFFYVGTNIRFDVQDVLNHIKAHQPNIKEEGPPKNGSRKNPAYRTDLDDTDATLKSGFPAANRFAEPDLKAPILVQCDRVLLSTEGDHVFIFGARRVRLSRSQYDIYRIGAVDNENGVWEQVQIWVDEADRQMYDLVPYTLANEGG